MSSRRTSTSSSLFKSTKDDESTYSPSGQCHDPEKAEEEHDAEPSFKTSIEESPSLYHISTHSQKLKIVWLISLAGVFAPLSSNIYSPAIVTIAKEFDASIELVMLSVTIYLIFQGLAPSFWGPLADSLGRRPIYMGTFIVYILANVGLGFSKSYAALMAFRALQSAGSAATIAIGTGVISDVTARAERGGLSGMYGGIRMLGQALGPVLGGALAQYLGFHSMFWFLLVSSSISLMLVITFLPETLRRIAGNGSRPLLGVYKPLIRNITHKNGDPDAQFDIEPRPPMTTTTFTRPFKLLLHKDVLCQFLFGASVYTAWSMVMASTTDLFKDSYHLNDVYIGLAFLPNGFGCILGSYFTGKILDRDYKIVQKQYREKKQLEPEVDVSADLEFPVERARLRSIWWIISVFIACMASYGWTLDCHIAIPLTLQFLIGWNQTAVLIINTTLVIDLYPENVASATAINNFVRCLTAALGVSMIEKLNEAVKERSAFMIIAGITLATCVCEVLEWSFGLQWRMRMQRAAPH